jgi:hypothetical protein
MASDHVCTVLVTTHWHRIQYNRTYLSRRKLWMPTTHTTCKRCITIFRLHLPTYLTKLRLRIIHHTRLICRCSNPILNHGNRIYRIRPTLRTNIILTCNSNYKPSISNSICRKGNCSMSMTRICTRQRHTQTLLCTTLLNTIRDRSNIINSLTISAPNRIK